VQTPTLTTSTQGSGPAVVLVHGTAPPVWGSLVEELARDHAVTTYARRSFAPPAGSPVASLREHTDDLSEVVAGLDRPVVVGWSIGGVLALDLALRRPQTVSGLLLVEAALHLKRVPTLAMVRAVIGAQRRGRRDAEAGARRFLDWAMQRRDGTADTDRLGRAAIAACAPAIVHELTLGTGEHEIARHDLATLAVPTIWVRGTESLPTFEKAARRAAAVSGAITLQVAPGAGHAVHLDRPDVLVAALRALVTT
jgi:pimeloyl-ACP methyl ester carboxylesterase